MDEVLEKYEAKLLRKIVHPKGLLLNGCRIIVVTAFPHCPYGKILGEYTWKPIRVQWQERIRVVRTFVRMDKNEM